jgi:hypothetical protein
MGILSGFWEEASRLSRSIAPRQPEAFLRERNGRRDVDRATIMSAELA